MGRDTTANQRSRKGRSGCRIRHPYVTENQQRKFMGLRPGLVIRVNQSLHFLVIGSGGTAQPGDNRFRVCVKSWRGTKRGLTQFWQWNRHPTHPKPVLASWSWFDLQRLFTDPTRLNQSDLLNTLSQNRLSKYKPNHCGPYRNISVPITQRMMSGLPLMAMRQGPSLLSLK